MPQETSSHETELAPPSLPAEAPDTAASTATASVGEGGAAVVGVGATESQVMRDGSVDDRSTTCQEAAAASAAPEGREESGSHSTEEKEGNAEASTSARRKEALAKKKSPRPTFKSPRTGLPPKTPAPKSSFKRAPRRGRRGRGNLKPGGLVAGPIQRRNKTIFSYGNYDPYFRQRHDKFAKVDQRVEALLRKFGPELFSQKTILDVGCNAGFVTFLVAALGAARIEGVDIDSRLISQALKRLRRLKQDGLSTLPRAPEDSPADARFPVSFVHCRGLVPYAFKPVATWVTDLNAPPATAPAEPQSKARGAPPPDAEPQSKARGAPPLDAETQSKARGAPPHDAETQSKAAGAPPPEMVAPKAPPLRVEKESVQAPATQQASSSDSAGAKASSVAMEPAAGGSTVQTLEASSSIEGRQQEEEDLPPPAFPYNIEFRSENVLDSEIEDKREAPYDVVLCLKLTKWVHLYWGDDGLKVLFHKCFRLLRPGGAFVLEAQEWQSYQSSKNHLTPHMKQTKSNLKFKPDEFKTYLVHVVGFLEPVAVAGNPPLKRPLLIFRRPRSSSKRELVDPDHPSPSKQVRPFVVPPARVHPEGSPRHSNSSPPPVGLRLARLPSIDAVHPPARKVPPPKAVDATAASSSSTSQDAQACGPAPGGPASSGQPTAAPIKSSAARPASPQARHSETEGTQADSTVPATDAQLQEGPPGKLRRLEPEDSRQAPERKAELEGGPPAKQRRLEEEASTPRV